MKNQVYTWSFQCLNPTDKRVDGIIDDNVQLFINLKWTVQLSEI